MRFLKRFLYICTQIATIFVTQPPTLNLMFVQRLRTILAVIVFLFTACMASAATPFTLVIDPGHGGHDAGAVGTVAKEKNINLKVALAFGRLVEQNMPGVRVIYTRKTDVFVTLQERANIANRAKADLFISIHTNAVASNKSAVSGAETYTLGMHRAADNLEVAKRENSVITMESDYKSKYQGFDPNKAESYIIFELMQDKHMVQSVKLAKAIQQQYGAAGRKNKGVHQAGFLVLRETSMPSVLTELGFISHPTEEAYLNSADGVSQLARSIYKGFANYHQQVTGHHTAELPQTEQAPQSAPATESKPVKEVAQNETPALKPMAYTPYPITASTPKEQATPASGAPANEPVFKIQLFTSDRLVKAGDARHKGLQTEYYRDGNIYKYTYGNSTDYNEIVNLKRSIANKFQGSFIIAFLNGKRIDLNEARRYKK